MSLLPASSSGEVSTGFYNGVIDQSLRFNEGDTPYLSRTFVTPSSTRKIIIATWIKPSELGDETPIMYSSSSNTQNYFLMGFAADGFISATDNFNLFTVEGNSLRFGFRTERLFRDPTNWMHVCVAIDTTQATSTDRVVLFFNGKRYTGSYSSYNTQPSENRDFTILNSAIEHRIGAYSNANHAYGNLDGYLSEFYFIDGQSIFSDTSATANSTFINSDKDTLVTFCEQKNGLAVPKAYSGTFGNNGCRLTFEGTGTGTTSQGTTAQTNIGDDQSGQGHNFSVNGLATADVVKDSPTNNFCVLNPLDKSGGTFSEGNLRYDTSSWDMATGTFLLPSGKWYYEVRVDAYNASANAFSVGIIQTNKIRGSGNSYYWSHSSWSTSSQGYLYGVNVNGTTEYKISAGSATSLSSHPDIVQGSVIGIFIDLESDTTSIKYNIDGGTPFELFTSMQDVDYTIGVSDYLAQLTFNFGQDSTFSGAETAGGNTDGNGKGDFHTALPSGHTDYLAICSANLSDPTIGPQTDTQADDHFDTILRVGHGSSGGSTPANFKADWIWEKVRSASYSHYLIDSSRGIVDGSTQVLITNTTNLETTGNWYKPPTSSSLEFNTNDWASSFSLVDWIWKANGGTTTTNDASSTSIGTIDSVFQANTTSGFSIVTYTGTGSAGTIRHGLSVAPSMVIIKSRTGASVPNWVIGQDQSGFTGQLYFDAGAFSSNSGSFNNTAPTSSVVSINTDSTVNQSTATYVMYCFANVEGYSKIGSWIGNGSTNGTFVYTGFRPAWIMLKRTSDSGGWQMLDNKRNTFNPVDNYLLPNLSLYEIDGSTLSPSIGIDFLSNGFKLRTTENVYNANGNTYIYLAFAEQPFKFSNAR